MLKGAFDPSSAIITPTDDVAPRYSLIVAGPPGTGKSTLVGSMAEVLGADRVLLLATLARELKSWIYQVYKIPHILFEDPEWQPGVAEQFDGMRGDGKYITRSYQQFLDTINWLRYEDDQYDAVIVDSGTELAELFWHTSLAPHGASSPSEMEQRSRWLPYETLANLLGRAIQETVSLTEVAKRPKHVAFTWHVQPPKEDTIESVGGGGGKVSKKSADHAAERIEYEGKVLPMVRGQYRRKVASQFDAVLYTNILVQPVTGGVSLKSKGMDVQYRVQVRPDPDRHTKVPGPLPDQQFIGNTFKEFLKLMDTLKAEPPKGKSKLRT